MNKNREGYLVSDVERECTKCRVLFKKTSKTVTLCNKCNSDRVKSIDIKLKMFRRAKARAKLKNIDFNLELYDIVIPETCPILGIKLEPKCGISGGQKNSPSLDKIDPNKGYIKSNIRVISHLANMMKSHASMEELLKFSQWINSEFSG